MNDKFRGLVLNTSDYKENDLLLQVMTKEYGVISLIGVGSKKMSARNHFMPFNLYEFIIDYKDGKTIYIPRGTKLVKTYFDESMKMIAYKNIFSQIIIKNKEMMDGKNYDELIFFLDNLNKDNMYCLGCLFVSSIIKQSGITPVVDGCVECGDEKVIGFSSRRGGFLCRNHAVETDILDVIRLKKFRLIIKAEFKHFNIVKDYEYDLKDFELLMDFYKENSDIAIQAYSFYLSLC